MKNLSERTFEEILPILAELTRKYTSGDSTSVSKERAETLLEAVIYCMNEAVTGQVEDGDRESLPAGTGRPFDGWPAEKLYRYGYGMVMKKVMSAKEIYESLLPEFSDYGNPAYQDTVIRAMPEFFRRYDVRFAPQNHLLMLDYPLLRAVPGDWTGVDRIHQYLLQTSLEQEFLNFFPKEYVREVLDRFHPGNRELILNICSVLLKNMLGHVLVHKLFDGKKPFDNGDQGFSESELAELTERTAFLGKEELKQVLTNALTVVFAVWGEGADDLRSYFSGYMGECAVEISMAAENGCLDRVFLL